MRFEIDMRDFAGPKMQRIAREMPQLIDRALRMTVARHRRRLHQFIKQNEAGHAAKSPLVASETSDPIARLNNRTKSADIRRKHAHRSLRPFTGKDGRHFADAVRYKRMGRFVYGYGFIGTSEKFAEALAKGLYMDPKTKRASNTVTPSMRRYFSAIGIGLKKDTKVLSYPKRPVVDEYLKRNGNRMIRDFAGMLFGTYDRAMGKTDKMNYTSVRTGPLINIA